MTTELFCGGRIYSPSAPDATAMAVTDGIVVWVGTDDVGRALHPDAEVIGDVGTTVAELTHRLSGKLAEQRQMLDLRQKILERLAERAEESRFPVTPQRLRAILKRTMS